MSVKEKLELPVPYSGKFKGSFAYLTIKDRLPVILVKVVDTLCQEKCNIGALYGEEAIEDGKEIIGKLSALQNEMVTNKLIKPLINDSPDASMWNEYLEMQKNLYGFPPAWFESPWLYVECYLYRRIKEAFELSSLLKNYDPFHKQKKESFLASIDGVVALCSALNHTLSDLKNNSNKTEIFNIFSRYLEVSLWGNKFDLSIAAGKENVQKHSPFSQLDEIRQNIIINDTEVVWHILQAATEKSKQNQIDFILDNAGFELFCDLCFIHFLQAAQLTKTVRLHVKCIPWFVSDALDKDIEWLLKAMLQSDQEVLINISKEWSKKIATGEWIIERETFWTLPHEYCEMQSTDSQLYNKLSQSDLIIFKGDLNYRKLTGDRHWDEAASFTTALNGFLPNSIVSLRTVKADAIVGLQPGTTKRLNELSSDWKYSGNFAVIQCAKTVQ